MNNKKLLMMMEISIFTALGLVLDKLSFSMPQGGSVSFVMLPILLIGLRWGLRASLTTGLLIGLLQMMFGAYVLHWVQGLLDYGVAFTVVGLGALLRQHILQAAQQKNKNKMMIWISIASLIGGFLRWTAHTVGGAVFFAEYAGDQNPWIYSIIYNGSYMLPATILTAVVGCLLLITAPKLLIVK